MKISLEERFWRLVDKSGECWLWLGALNKHRYGVFWNGQRCEQAHRVAWRLKNGAIPDGLHVLHRCDNPTCVRHLFLGTHKDNMRDAGEKGRMGKLLTAADVVRVREVALTSGARHCEIGAWFGISRRQVGAIVRRTSWGYTP